MANTKITDGSMALNDRQVRVITIEATRQPEEIKLRVAAYGTACLKSAQQLDPAPRANSGERKSHRSLRTANHAGQAGRTSELSTHR